MNKKIIRRFLYYVLILGLFTAMAAFAVLTVKDAYPFVKSDIEIWQLREEVKEKKHNKTWEERSTMDGLNWEKMKEINPDIVAWITVPGTQIDYPILQCSTWNEYLHKNYKGEYSYPGSIFIQPGVRFTDRHVVIYGHNMASRSMFGSLHDYESQDFGLQHPDVYIYEQGRTIHARIYSTYDCEDASETYQTDFQTEEEWMTWLTMTIEENYYDMEMVPVKENRVLTLSTCFTGKNEDSRYTVHSVIQEITEDMD